MRSRRLLAALSAAALAVVLLVAFREPLVRSAAQAALGLATGTRASIGALTVGSSGLVASDVQLARGGAAIFSARRVSVRYNLRDLLPGGTHRYGLHAVDVDRPILTVHRARDGTLDVSGGAGAPRAAAPPTAPAGETPLRMDARVRDGSVVFVDPYRVDPGSRRFVVDALNADASIDTSATTRYRAGATYEAGGARTLVASGTVDAQRLIAMHDVTAASLPLRAIVNYFINGPVATLAAGEARSVHVRLFQLGADAPYHLSGGADLHGLTLAVKALEKPLSDLGGHVEAFDDGVAASRLDGTIAGVSVRMGGGLFDFSQPRIRLAALAQGPFEQLRSLFAFTARQPVTGNVDLAVLIEGRAADPLILARVSSGDAGYGKLPISRLGATVAYYRSAASLVPLSARYGGIDLTARGAFLIGEHLISELALSALAPAAAVPYAAQTIPGALLHASGLVSGVDGAFNARGIVHGSGGGDAVQGLFDVDERGNGRFGPLLLTRADGSSLAGDFYQARSSNDSAVLIDARRFALVSPEHPPRLPGMPALAPPRFSGVLDASVVGVGPPSAFVLAGTARLTGMSIGGIHIASATGRVLGTLTDARLADLRASGPWGGFSGAGGFDGRDLALAGDYRGSFGALEPFTGKLGAVGAIVAPIGLLVEPNETIVQTTDARMPDASVHGVRIDAVTGTLSASKGGVRVYAAQARVGGAQVAAGGAIGPGRSIGLAIADADARALRPLGVPLDRGRVSAVGTAGAGTGGLDFHGGAVVRDGSVLHVALAGNGDVAVDGTRARFGRVDGRVATVYGTLAGALSALGSRAPHYDVAVRIRASDVGELAKATGHDPYHLDGSADADLHVGGAGSEPLVTGRVVLPEATINGLFVDHAWADVHAMPSAVALEEGGVTVGSTAATFGGAVQGSNVSLAVDAKRADLTDFNNFFDPGDFMAGTGHLQFGFEWKRSAFAATSGDVALSGLRVEHFDLGSASANWASTNSRVSGTVGFAGRLGRFDTSGSVGLATRAPLRRLIARSRFDLRASAIGLDVGAWLPAIGYDLPVGGRIDANGTIRGQFPALAVSGTATLLDGTVAKLPVDRLTVSASSTVSRATITNAELEIGSISARGSGSFGFAPTAPLQLALHASSPDIGTVVAKLTGNKLPVSGAFETDVHVVGKPAAPDVEGGFDVERGQVAGVAIPRVLGEFGMTGRHVELRDAEVAFATGALYLAGTIPLTIEPFGLGPANAPLALDARAQGIGLDNFAPLLPTGSAAKGTIDGRLAARGTVDAPALTGELGLAGGEITIGGFESQPLRNVSGRLSVAGTQARLETLHADAGGGRIDASGSASVPDLTRPGVDGTYDLKVALSHANLNVPAYGRGQVDGTLSFHHDPGTLAVVGGNASIADAVIPFSALYNPSAGGGDAFALATAPTTRSGLPNVAFDLDVGAGRNVRVRSSVMDIGGTGSVHVGGTLESPQISGGFDSTGGTLTYFNTVFRVLDGTVSFQPSLGVVPILDARATAHVINPDPNAQRNLTGSADITLTVRGPVTNLTIALESNPAYDRSQILGLLLSAPAIGATNLFDTPAAPGSPPTPTLSLGTTAPGGGITVAQEAFGVLNAQFTRSLLAPLESAFGGALGLSDINFTFGYTGNVGVSARKLLGRNIYAVYGTTFGYPYRQTFGFELRPTPTTAAQFTFYETVGDVYGYVTSPVTGSVSRETLAQPITGQSGFSFSLQRFFW